MHVENVEPGCWNNTQPEDQRRKDAAISAARCHAVQGKDEGSTCVEVDDVQGGPSFVISTETGEADSSCSNDRQAVRL